MKKQPSPPDSISLWELAENDENRNRARVFERDWHESYRLAGYRPAIDDYLPVASTQRLAALLALARVDMACRYDTRDRPRVEDYLHLIDADELTIEFLAGLAFEEYMLRYDDGEEPKMREYRSRFPGAFGLFQELVLIQQAVVGEMSDLDCGCGEGNHDLYPEPGQVIGNFELLEILGCGSFAKVYLARDLSMGGRQVALKVSEDNKLEWLTLARLQHTHIVPIYSHGHAVFEDRDYDLICMPYYGSVTLRTLIQHEQWGNCLTGRDIQDLVDLLQPGSPVEHTGEMHLNTEMSRMSFAQAIACWGACLAEAMHHAHQRRVLHRDVKPTNILITTDGEPMLLDFNLAMEGPLGETSKQRSVIPFRNGESSIGGTLAYMAPEHLEAMISGQTRLVDHRADIYSLGAVLYEALTRNGVTQKSHAPAESRAEMLQQAIELRKIPPIPVRDIAPDVPLVLDRVVRKCIDPNPARRYTSAKELSEDLMAIAQDRPLHHTNEPLTNRFRRLARQNRRTMVALTSMLVFLFMGPGLSLYQNLEQKRLGQLVLDISDTFQAADHSIKERNYSQAIVFLRKIQDKLEKEPSLVGDLQKAEARRNHVLTLEYAEMQSREFVKRAAWLRYKILHSTRFGGELNHDARLLEEVRLHIHRVIAFHDQALLQNINKNSKISADNWVLSLSQDDFKEIADWMDLLIFETICSQFRDQDEPLLRTAYTLGQRVPSFTQPGLPWTILNERLSALLEKREQREINWPEPEHEQSALSCMQFARLAQIDGKPELAEIWLRRAILLNPTDPWIQHELALLNEFRGDFAAARIGIAIANSLDRRNPWPQLDLARIERLSGRPAQAERMLEEVRAIAFEVRLPEEFIQLIDLETALVQQDLFQFEQSGTILRRLINESGTIESLRLLAAQSLCEQFLADRKFGEIQEIMDRFDPHSSPTSSWAVFRARLLLENGQAKAALGVISPFVKANPDFIQARELKARILAKIDRPQEALREMKELISRSDTPEHRRLLESYRMQTLARLNPANPEWQAAMTGLRIEDQQEVLLLPGISQRIVREAIQRMVDFIQADTFQRLDLKPIQNRYYLNLAILQSAVRQSGWRDSLSKSMANEQASAGLIRSQIMLLIRQKELDAASVLLNRARALVEDESELADLLGLVFLGQDRATDAINEFDRYLGGHRSDRVLAWRAESLSKMGRFNEAMADLSEALTSDPFNPNWRMQRANVWKKLGRQDFADIDLFLAGVESQDNFLLKSRLTLMSLMSHDYRADSDIESSVAFNRFIRENLQEFIESAGILDSNSKKDEQIKQAGGDETR